MKKKLFAAAAAAAAILLIGLASPAFAAEPDVHPDVEYAVSAVPGGTVVDPYTVVWPELGMTLTVPSPFARSVGSCATGQYCAYASPGGNGTRLTFGICTVVSTAALPTVTSVANARSSGSVQARSSASTVLGTAAAGTLVNVAGGTTTLRCTL